MAADKNWIHKMLISDNLDFFRLHFKSHVYIGLFCSVWVFVKLQMDFELNGLTFYLMFLSISYRPELGSPVMKKDIFWV